MGKLPYFSSKNGIRRRSRSIIIIKMLIALTILWTLISFVIFSLKDEKVYVEYKTPLPIINVYRTSYNDIISHPLWNNKIIKENSQKYSEIYQRNRLLRAYDTLSEFITTKLMLEKMMNISFLNIDSVTALDVISMTREQERQRILFTITPTYKRSTQLVDMTRVMQTLQLATILHDVLIYWIVIEDSETCTQRIRDLLIESQLPFAHLAIKKAHRIGEGCTAFDRIRCHRGIFQRHRALELIEIMDIAGLVYFADDDNAYTTQLFRDIQTIKSVGVFPTGFNGAANYQRCLVNSNGLIKELFTNYKYGGGHSFRKYPVDMGGMAFTTYILKHRHVRFNSSWPLGTLETNLMNLMVDRIEDIEPLGGNCTKVLFWHVRTAGARTDRLMDDPEFKNIVQLV